MQQFSDMSCLRINQEKCTIFFAGVCEEDHEDLKNIWCFEDGVFPIRYLGVPLSPRKLKNSEFDPLIRKMTARIQGGWLRT